ncbi:stage V sporulation protein AB [Microaerobacter geothermalis]|uniref:stage V sporulation protein AB n=1 Tax=Microaerobacter geothermalis TaxID=674972 RepID=UPI001F2FFFE9|nr:stage V sporulation protein AB [Microaerobacter geothermalis]MCF6093476.1 stage V sporulation protein AB [Microaerobacter geothermalis]
MIKSILLIFFGFSGGIAVGGGFVAFLTVLDVIPRLCQVTHSYHYIRWYEGAVILGALFGSLWGFLEWTFHVWKLWTAIIGVFAGIYIGLLAAALTEVLNVLPILAKRISMQEKVLYFLMAMVFGKIFGSLIQWMVFNR